MEHEGGIPCKGPRTELSFLYSLVIGVSWLMLISLLSSVQYSNGKNRTVCLWTYLQVCISLTRDAHQIFPSLRTWIHIEAWDKLVAHSPSSDLISNNTKIKFLYKIFLKESFCHFLCISCSGKKGRDLIYVLVKFRFRSLQHLCD